jgi:alpha-ketoglutaric semialdehyde dehydrogenase
MTLTGKLIIGCGRIENTESFSGIEAASGRLIDPTFSAAGPDEVDRACEIADLAAIPYASTDREERARFLEQIADNIMAIGPERSVNCGCLRQRCVMAAGWA